MASDATSVRVLLQAGGYCPIPVVGKVPALLAWQKHIETSAAEIQLWRKLYPDAVNTGILTRLNPTVDADLLNEEAAEAVEGLFREYLEERGHFLVRMGRAPKRAFLLRTDVPFPKMVRNVIAPNGTTEKIEVLCDGQQVVVFGIHPDTKRPYLWHGGEPGTIKYEDLPYVRAEELVELLDQAVALLCRDHGYTAAASRPERPKATNGTGSSRGADDWGYLIDNVLDGRHLHDSAASLTSKLAKAGLSAGAMFNLMLALHERSAAADDGSSDRYQERLIDLNRMVDSAVRKYGSNVIPLDAGRSKGTQQRFKLTQFASLRSRAERRYSVKGILPRTGLVVVWGPPKCGKSFWTFDVVMHIATGWMYRKHRVRAGTVVYCAFEGADGFNERADAFRAQHPSVSDDVPFYLMPAVMDMVADHKQLIADIREQAAAPAVVVLDTLNRSLVGSESSDEDMAAYVRASDAIREAFDCLVIIVHHCGVDGTRPRGHTSLTGAVDTQIAVKRDTEKNVVVLVELLKDGPEGEVITSRLQTVELGLDEDGDAMTSCVVVPAEAGGEGKKKISAQAVPALRMLHEALAEHGKVPPPGGRVPANTMTCGVSMWRQFCYSGTIADSDKPDSKKRAFQRARNELQKVGIIGVWNDQVWVAAHAGHAAVHNPR